MRGTIAPLLAPAMMHAVGLHGSFALSLGMILAGAAMQYFGVRIRYEGNGRYPTAGPMEGESETAPPDFVESGK